MHSLIIIIHLLAESIISYALKVLCSSNILDLAAQIVILVCALYIGTGTETTENVTDICTADNAMGSADNTTQSADNMTESADNTMESADDTTEYTDNTTESADNAMESADNTTESADNMTESANNTTVSADNAVDTLLTEPSGVVITTVLWSLVGLLTLISAVSLSMCTILSICLCVCFTHREQGNTSHGKFA